VANEEMNARLRARGRRAAVEPAVEAEPEERPSFDYGRGARVPLAPRDPHRAANRWLAQQLHRSRLESVTVDATTKR
jgi:hypothetical protein